MTSTDDGRRAEDASPRTANIFDVARLAGVSHQTVSRVLNDLPNVRPATRARVESAISQLRYSPSPAARAMPRRPRGGEPMLRISKKKVAPTASYMKGS